MSWYQLEVTLCSGDLPRAETLLRLSGAEAFSVRDAEHADILEPDPGTTPLWPRVIVTALCRSEAIAAAGRGVLENTMGNDTAILVQPLSDADWRETWTQRPTTQTIGDRLAIVAAHEDWKDSTRVDVRLNLGLAFGTGDHPTTSLCLEWLDHYLQRDTRVLDYGCGSGVLAITALRLGAASAWAVDIDRQALLATQENAELNDVLDRLWVGTPDKVPAVEVDIVIANILAQPLQHLAAQFRDSVVPGGHVVLSGILSQQSEAVQQAYAGSFGPFVERRRGDWVCLAAPRI